VIRALAVVATLALAGCSFSAGGWSACFLDHADLSVSVEHPHNHADPNAHQP